MNDRQQFLQQNSSYKKQLRSSATVPCVKESRHAHSYLISTDFKQCIIRITNAQIGIAEMLKVLNYNQTNPVLQHC